MPWHILALDKQILVLVCFILKRLSTLHTYECSFSAVHCWQFLPFSVTYDVISGNASDFICHESCNAINVSYKCMTIAPMMLSCISRIREGGGWIRVPSSGYLTLIFIMDSHWSWLSVWDNALNQNFYKLWQAVQCSMLYCVQVMTDYFRHHTLDVMSMWSPNSWAPQLSFCVMWVCSFSVK